MKKLLLCVCAATFGSASYAFNASDCTAANAEKYMGKENNAFREIEGTRAYENTLKKGTALYTHQDSFGTLYYRDGTESIASQRGDKNDGDVTLDAEHLKYCVFPEGKKPQCAEFCRFSKTFHRS